MSFRTTYFKDTFAIGFYSKTARIWTIQWTDAGLCFDITHIINVFI